MATIEIDGGRQNDWVAVPKALLIDPRLSWKAKALWCYLAGSTETTPKDMRRAGRDSSRAIRAGLKELKEAGYLTTQKVKGVLHVGLGLPGAQQLQLGDLDKVSAARAVSSEDIELRRQFDELMRAYPPRMGAAQRPAAFAAYKKQRKDGSLHVHMVAAAKEYARWCVAENRAGTQYVLSPARFFSSEWHQWYERSSAPQYKTTAGGMKIL
jgi:hypothetical protein